MQEETEGRVNGPIILVVFGMVVMCVAMASCVMSVWVR